MDSDRADECSTPRASNARFHDKPLAAHGLISYRAKSRFGWVMIGAKDAADAWAEACRSTDSPTGLQVWNGERYVPLSFPPPYVST